jgi:hypothetical protein
VPNSSPALEREIRRWREREPAMERERERSGHEERDPARERERDPAMERERPGYGEREREIQLWRERPGHGERKRSLGRRWAAALRTALAVRGGRRILEERILEKKSGKSGGKFGLGVLEAEMIFFF